MRSNAPLRGTTAWRPPRCVHAVLRVAAKEEWKPFQVTGFHGWVDRPASSPLEGFAVPTTSTMWADDFEPVLAQAGHPPAALHVRDVDVIQKDATTRAERRAVLASALANDWAAEDPVTIERIDEGGWHGWALWPRA